jgi:Zn-dependent protease with chaperone function
VPNQPAESFSAEERERARRYHRPLYLAIVARVLLVVAVYALLAGHDIEGLGWAGDAAAWSAIVIVAASLVTLPLDLWRGFVRERQWELSTQTVSGWFSDRAKALLISLVLLPSAWTGLIALTYILPRWWPAAATAAAALLVVVLTLLAPLLLEPLFNSFRPLEDKQLARELRDLAVRAGVPIRNVLVADASRRTAKSNAYVSGLGPTRRVVVWDTLLRTASERELKLVLAHELGHRREHHLIKGTAFATAGAVAAVLTIWLAFGTPQPDDYPLAALLLTALELAAMPFGAALSRRWERTADRYSLQLTGDHDAYVRAHISLARTNLADLDPPRLAYLALFTHPTPPQRLALAKLSEQ